MLTLILLKTMSEKLNFSTKNLASQNKEGAQIY